MNEAQSRQVSQVSITVLVATYNGVEFIRQQLDSILSQSCQPTEIVICDDQSVDGTHEVIQEYSEKSVNIPIRIFVNRTRKGHARNFIDGIAYCTGDYIAFCDQDDLWLPDKLKVISEIIRQSNYPGMVFSDCTVTDSDLSPTGQTGFEYLKMTPEARTLIKSGGLFELLVLKPYVTGMTMVCRRQDLEKMPLDMVKSSHDYYLSTAFAAISDYAMTEEALVLYRQHSKNSIGMSKKKHRKLQLLNHDFIEQVNADLQDKASLFSFCKIFSERSMDLDNTLLDNLIAFTAVRLASRLGALDGKRFNELSVRIGLTEKEKRKMRLKDQRTRLKIILHRFLIRLKQ